MRVPQRYLKISEVAQRLNVCENTVRKLERKGHFKSYNLPGVTRGRRYFWPEIYRFMQLTRLPAGFVEGKQADDDKPSFFARSEGEAVDIAAAGDLGRKVGVFESSLYVAVPSEVLHDREGDGIRGHDQVGDPGVAERV